MEVHIFRYLAGCIAFIMWYLMVGSFKELEGSKFRIPAMILIVILTLVWIVPLLVALGMAEFPR